MKNINLVIYLNCLCVFGGLVWFFFSIKLYSTCYRRDGITQKQWDCPTAMKPFPPAMPHDRNTPATGQRTPRDARGQRSHGRGEHIPWHLAHAALDGSCAWHMEMRRETKAAAHKVVIAPPGLLLPHVGFHSSSIASQQLHTQHLFYYI